MSEYYKDAHKYEDIISLPHHQSAKRAPMSLHDRAAQFAPFAALTGHEDAIEETARLTESKVILDDTAIEKINMTLYYISEHLSEKKQISITYFKADSQKEGGSYLTDIGVIKKIDNVEKKIIMDSGIEIFMENIIELEINS